MSVDGRYSELSSPALEMLLEVIEQTETLEQSEGERAGNSPGAPSPADGGRA